MKITTNERIKGTLTISEKANISRSVTIDNTGNIIIESYVEIYDGVNIFTHKHKWNHSRGLRKDIEKIIPIDLLICRDAFIGKNAIILAIDRIGAGAVIGAGSVITKNVPAYEVWAGNPAKRIGKRKKHEG